MLHLSPYLYGIDIPVKPMVFNANLTQEQQKGYKKFYIKEYTATLWIKIEEDAVPNIPQTQTDDMAYWNTAT